ncbi:hypothetical protein [Pseudogemmobacter bohemicus]|uniref:hypothetical protein n=1 Tax=Pseudogemmobacter bohemicus TaxID=2250708 RepID=UPI0013003E86|nr:hypothetical protein [Pseudogemmobacter bohemicus]
MRAHAWCLAVSKGGLAVGTFSVARGLMTEFGVAKDKAETRKRLMLAAKQGT